MTIPMLCISCWLVMMSISLFILLSIFWINETSKVEQTVYYLKDKDNWFSKCDLHGLQTVGFILYTYIRKMFLILRHPIGT